MSLSLPLLLIGRYLLTAEIGRGGHAVVYRANDNVLDREVAVKVLREDTLAPDVIARFRKEVELTAKLEHAHILHIYDTGTFEGRPFIVMELASGNTLADRLGREGQLPIADALQIVRDIALALSHAHARGIVHRDVKPENILLGSGGAILADFGIARLTQEAVAQRITSTGTAVGTVLYMSPEQLGAEPNVDARSDQYSLACVLYEMLTGVRPHVSATFQGLRVLRFSGHYVSACTHRSLVPANVDRAIAIALSSMPADRFRTMEDFLAAMGATHSGNYATTNATTSASTSGRSVQVQVENPNGSHLASGARRRWIVPTGLVAAVAISLLAGWNWFGSGVASAPTNGGTTVAVIVDKEKSNNMALANKLSASVRDEFDGWGLQLANQVSAKDTGLVARLSVREVGDSLRVRVDLGEGAARTERPLERLIPKGRDEEFRMAVAGLVIEALQWRANHVLTIGDTPGLPSLTGRSLDALNAYVKGFSFLRAGLLDSAVRSFHESVIAAPSFAEAEFWMAQSDAWTSPGDSTVWKQHAQNAVGSGMLRGVDSLLADALAALSRADYPAACDSYRAATRLDPTSFVAMFGLGECQRVDRLLIKTGVGYRFRSSVWSALDAYKKSIALAPTAEWLGALFERVMQTTFAASGSARKGPVLGRDGVMMTALPSLDHDTLAFFPLDAGLFQTASSPDSWNAAVRRGQLIAQELTAKFVAQSSRSPAAYYQRALALELSGQLSTVEGVESAGDNLDRAESFAKPNPQLSADIVVTRTRIEVRRGNFERAVLVARQALAKPVPKNTYVRAKLMPLAALIGDFQRAEALGLPYPSRDGSIPAPLSDSIEAFELRAQLGDCDSLDVHLRNLESTFAAQYSGAEGIEKRAEQLSAPYRQAVPCLKPHLIREFVPKLQLERAYQAMDRNDYREANKQLELLRQSRLHTAPSFVSWDWVFAEAHATALAGDTVASRKQLVDALNGIATMSKYTLDQAAQAAGLRRGLILLEQIARKNPTADEVKWLARGKVFTTH